jgi:uncharacterized membrane-anchored protein
VQVLEVSNKVPEITLAFWAIKICATTLGETGGDLVSMTLGLGYLASTGLFLLVFLVLAAAQIRARRYHAALYWGVILATTTAGTTLSDFLDRTAHLGYLGGSLALSVSLVAVLVTWYLVRGRLVFQHVVSAQDETFYWLAILVSNTLGTALGDYTSDDAGLGFGGGAALFGSLLAIIVIAYKWTSVSRVVLFWLAFVLTRPLGAALGDLLTKPHSQGGMELGTVAASSSLAVAVIVLVLLSSRRPVRAFDG